MVKMEFFKTEIGFIEKYYLTVKFAGIKIPPNILLAATLAIAGAVLLIGTLFGDITLFFMISLLILDAGIGIPFFLADRKIEAIEKKLPDVLHHMAITLKTSGTIEMAMKEVVRMDYGEITKGIKRILREISEGKTFEDSFRDYAYVSRSMLLQKSAIIIIAARKSGGRLSDTLIAIGEDVRNLSNLRRERKSKTFMQFSFIVAAGCLVAPFVFGILKSVIDILFTVGGTTAGGVELAAFFGLLFKSYLIIESSLCTFGAIQIREGTWTKGVLYVPIFVVITYIIYTFVSISFMGFMGL